MKRIGVILLALCVTANSMMLPVFASGTPSDDVAVESVIIGEGTGEPDENKSEVADTTEEEIRDDSSEVVKEEVTDEEEPKKPENEDEEKREDVSEETIVEDDEMIDDITTEIDEEDPVSPDDDEVLSAGKDQTWTDTVYLSKDTVVNGNLTVKGELYLKGYKLTVKGNMIASANVYMDTNGELYVQGNYVQTKGKLETGAVVDVTGDLRFQGINDSGQYVRGEGYIYTCYSNSLTVNVGGDFVFDSSNSYSNDGIYNLAGNFTDTGNTWEGTFNFVGNGTQIITMASRSRITGGITANKKLIVTEYFNVSLNGPVTVDALNDTIKISSNVYLNGYSLTVNGNIIASMGIFCDENSEFTVNGNYVQTGSFLNIYGGSVFTVSGDLRFQGIDSSGQYVQGWGYFLSFIDAELNVGGDFVYDSANYSKLLGESTFHLKGAFVDYNGNEWKGKFYFDANSIQTIDATADTNFVGGISTKKGTVKIVKYFSGRLNKSVTFTSDEATIYTEKGIELNGYSLTVNKSLEASDGIRFGQGSVLTVKGNFIQKSGQIHMFKSSCVLNVTKNFLMEGRNQSTGKPEIGDCTLYTGYSYDPGDGYEIPVLNIGGNFENWSSDFVADNYANWNVKGNFTDKSSNYWNGVVTLNGNVSAKKKQTVNVGSGRIRKLVLLSCGDFYVIPEGCCNDIVQPDHVFDKGVVIQATTKSTHGKKLYTCTVCAGTKTGNIPFVHETFSDIKTSDWWWGAVQYAYENDIMGGSNGTFKPANPITREQMVQVFYNCEGKPAVSIQNDYADVVKGQYYVNAVLWAKEKGIASGKVIHGVSMFGVGDNITRQDLSVMMFNYAKFKGYTVTYDSTAINKFKDSGKVSNYAKNAMNWAVTNGIMSGKGDNLDPLGNATRAEVSSMMKRLREANGE